MLEKILITFASEDYESKRSLTVSSTLPLVDRVINYCPKDLDEVFVKQNNKIMSQSRGYGYWLWKPYIILQTIKSLDDSCMVIYCDSGDLISENIISKAKQHIDQGVFLVESNHKNYQFTKSDCFVLMDCNDEKYWNSNQIYASISFWRNTDFSVYILEEWLKFCKNPQIITDSSNIYSNNHSSFIDHRHDQSILTNVAIKNSVPTCKEKSSNPWDVF